MKDYYKSLGIRQFATDAEIKRAYRELAKRYHPDVTQNAKDAEYFSEVTEAYETLTDPNKRSEYDAILRQTETAKRKTEEQKKRSGSAQATFITRDGDLAKRLQDVYSQGYQEGYVAGYNASTNDLQKNLGSLGSRSKQLSDENEKIRAEMVQLKGNCDDLEHELFARDRELSEREEQLRELEYRLQWFKEVVAAAAPKNDPLQQRATSMRNNIEALKRDLERSLLYPDEVARDITTIHQQERRKQIRDELIKADDTIIKLTKELADIKVIEDQKRKLLSTAEDINAMEARAESWAKKQRADQNAAKNTHYGTLGLLIRATPKEIDDAYEKLFSKYSDSIDPADNEKLEKIKHAYAVLANSKSRSEYNKSLGYTDEMIIADRKIADDNVRLQNEYYKKLEARNFWARFDEINAIALAGNAIAQNSLGEIYYAGKNIKRDFEHAVYWFREAFEQGYPAGIYNLGVCYLKGQGVGRNASIAKALFRQARLRSYEPPEGSPTADGVL